MYVYVTMGQNKSVLKQSNPNLWQKSPLIKALFFPRISCPTPTTLPQTSHQSSQTGLPGPMPTWEQCSCRPPSLCGRARPQKRAESFDPRSASAVEGSIRREARRARYMKKIIG